MTDNEIIKAFANYIKNGSFHSGIRLLLKNALDLINRQKAEIDRLQKENKTTREYLHDNGLEWDLLSYSKRKEHN